MRSPRSLSSSGERLALPGQRSTRRDDQTRETRRRLIGAAIGLIGEVGWRDATIEQIAERAGVAKGTFFVHFKTKEAIVLTLVQLQNGAANAARDAALEGGGSPVDALRAATITLGTQAAASVELSRAVLIASLESREVGAAADKVFSELLGRMVVDAQAALDQGLLEAPAGVTAATIATMLMGSYLGAALHCASAPNAKSMGAVLTPLVDATLGALKAKANANVKKQKKRGAPR